MQRIYIISHISGRVVDLVVMDYLCNVHVRHYTSDILWSYLLFELLYLTGSEAVGLRDERNHINFVLQGLHELYIDGTKPTGGHELY